LLAFFIAASLLIAVPVKALPSVVWVDDGYTAATSGWGVTRFDKIQDGIDAVAIGGTVHVLAGTYIATSLASVVIAKPLTLSGQSQYNTIIDAGVWGASGAGWPRGIHSYADNVVIEGFTVQGFTGDLINTGGYGVVFRDWAHDTAVEGFIYYTNCVLRNVRVLNCYSSIYALVHTHLTVENCYVKDSLADGMFIARYSSYATITHNTVLNSGDNGIWVGYCWSGIGPSDHATITYNTVDGAREGGISFVASDDALIEGNTVTNVKGEEPDAGWSRGAISLKDGVSNVIVTGNKIIGNDGGGTGSGRGIGIDGSWSNIDINHNFIKDNTGGGIKVMGTGTGYFRCNYNCISGNGGYGAENTLATLLDFENNYWGDSTGPYHPTTNPAGHGDWVSNNVDYDPWLTSCPLAPPVGGEWVPVNAIQMLVQLVGSIVAMSAIVASFVGFKRIKKRQN
jgi:parallel beta-helix repeat protein